MAAVNYAKNLDSEDQTAEVQARLHEADAALFQALDMGFFTSCFMEACMPVPHCLV